MNSQPCPVDGQQSPLPVRQFRRFILFFHMVFIGGLAVSLSMRWRRPESVFGWTDIVLLGLVVIQVALYLWLFAIPSHTGHWPSRWSLAFYFVASAAVFFAECRLERAFNWAVGAYMGQLLALPWRTALPATAALFVGFFVSAFGWTGLTRLSLWEWLIGVGTLTAWTGLALFLHRALATSSERGRLILELEVAKRELELARERDAELAVLEERERLARDLHDSLGHSLVTLTVQLEAAQRLIATEPSRAGALLAEMQKLTRSSMEDLRRSLANLRAAGLGDRPLAEALRTLCADARQRSGLSVECELAEGANHLPPRVSEVIWRLAQEGLANVEKHARARVVQVQLRLLPQSPSETPSSGSTGYQPVSSGYQPDDTAAAVRADGNGFAGSGVPAVPVGRLPTGAGKLPAPPASHTRSVEVVLQVRDDGIGLPPDAESKPGHYGLRGLRERVEGIGGTFTLTTVKPTGTLLEARVPLIG